MALFPQGLSHIDPRCANAGERAVLRQLKRCLEDDYIVWHDVPLGPKARQPDFVILSPRWGVLLLEVKHWKRATLQRASRDSVTLATERGLVTEGNPLRQARDYALELVDLMAADPALVHADGPFRGRLLFPYGWGVVFSNLRADAQSIYQAQRRRFNFASVGIEARGRTSILRLNYRNTAEVLALAMRCAQALLASEERGENEVQRVAPATAGRRGPMPVLIEARHEREEAELIAERVAAALAAGAAPGEIAVLCRTRALMRPTEAALARRGIPLQSMNAQAFRRFDWSVPAVRLLTMHSAKGLEFPIVIVAGLQALPWRDEPIDEAVRLLYVAMTRSTRELVLSAHGRSPIVERVRQALAGVSASFAAAAT